jgi:hypothetical protein
MPAKGQGRSVLGTTAHQRYVLLSVFSAVTAAALGVPRQKGYDLSGGIMNEVTEHVDLPDPAVQPLVHPLDLPGARRLFRTSWLIEASTSPPVGALVAALVWFASRNYLVPLVAGAGIVGFGRLASRATENQAWAFIPPRRRDLQRPLPASWELGLGLALAAVLAAALLLVTFRLDRPDVAAGVREFTFGMGAAAGLLVAADVVIRLLRYRDQARRRLLFPLPAAVAVLASVAVAYGVLFGASGPGSPATVLWGTALMLAAGVGVGIWKHLQDRPPTGE